MNTTTPHGVHGCYCEDCLGNRIRLTIAEHTMLIRHALLAATHPAGALGRKHRALARRIHQRETDYLKFAHNPAVPFTNNTAEQEFG